MVNFTVMLLAKKSVFIHFIEYSLLIIRYLFKILEIFFKIHLIIFYFPFSFLNFCDLNYLKLYLSLYVYEWCVCGHACGTVHVWRSEGNCGIQFSSLMFMGVFDNKLRPTNFPSKCLYPISYLSSPLCFIIIIINYY